MGAYIVILWQEIARFMQKQEIKAKRRSRELEPVQEYRENDRRTACDRQVAILLD